MKRRKHLETKGEEGNSCSETRLSIVEPEKMPVLLSQSSMGENREELSKVRDPETPSDQGAEPRQVSISNTVAAFVRTARH